MTEDSVKLLRECDAGLKMAIYDLDNIKHGVGNETLKNYIEESRKEHMEIKVSAEEYLSNAGEEEKEPPAMAKGMAYMKTNMKMMTEKNDEAAARLLWDGCFMGIKTVIGYMNKYKNAEEFSKKTAEDIIKAEEKLLKEIKVYI